MSEPLKIFITYAHRNTAEKEELKTRLAVMEQQDEITIWHDNEILPGDTWREAIFNNLAESDILLYLVSADSLASKNCNKELSEAIKNTDKNITIIPIILEDCDWQQHQLSNFQALPDSGKPINEWQPKSTGWQSTVKGIRKVVKKIVDSRGKSTPDQQDQKEQLAGLGQHLLSLGNFGMMLGQVEIAVETYSYAIKLKPDLAEAYNNRGIAYSDKGELNRAIQDYNKAIELKPDFAEAYNNRGVAYSDKGDFDQAIQDFNEAIKLNPDYAKAYFNRGVAYSDKGDFDQAIQDFDKAIELKPDFADAYFNRGIAYRDKDDFDQAIQDYNEVIKLKPDFAEAYDNRGIAYGNKGDFDQAIQDYNEAIELKPDYAIAYFNRGCTWLHLGEWEKARADLTTAKNTGVDIADLFRTDHKSVADFEWAYSLELPEDIVALLTGETV